MTLLEKLELIDRAHCLIKRKGTGSPDKFAERLGISERSLYNLLDLMKEMDAPIEYNDFRQSYYYKDSVELNIGFEKVHESRRIRGGNSDLFFSLQEFCSDVFYIGVR